MLEESLKHVKEKYRGTPTYFRVITDLMNAAQYQGLTTYQHIAAIMGLPLSGNHMQREVGYILGEISDDEVAAGRPMLSSVAVGINGKPGSGFYSLAYDLGLLPTKDENIPFWEAQRESTYSAWRRPFLSKK